MPPSLRDVTGDFARGQATLETLRAAAREERTDRQLAGEVLRLIAEWQNDPWRDSDRARNDLRDRLKQLAPPAPPDPPAAARRQERGESLYEAGLRGQRRRP